MCLDSLGKTELEHLLFSANRKEQEPRQNLLAGKTVLFDRYSELCTHCFNSLKSLARLVS